ncbi:MAG: hypothetical protein EHM35_07405 [Planctomycetaceae bacterium]|nr:MAG: hypothetical protein EHM35_07405 [Planctomycetaceae bacterium]
MEMRAFQELNAARGKTWNPNDSWDLNEWLIAVGAELGGAMAISRRMNRVKDGMWTRGEETNVVVLKGQMVERLAHLYILLDLVFSYLEVSKERAVARKFNAIGEAWDYPERMDIPGTDVRF